MKLVLKVGPCTQLGLALSLWLLAARTPDGLAACAIARGIAGLDHEATDDPVEEVPVEVAIPRVSNEVLHRLWALDREELDVDVT